MFTIMHISDLHRSLTHPISNDELLSCLVTDRERQRRETPLIAPVNAIIVTGDIIQGVPLDFVDYTNELQRQYDVALKSLVELAARFVNGDRTRVILLPGNHDVDWNISRDAMTLAGKKGLQQDLRRVLSQRNSVFRWCWKTRRLFQINDVKIYD